MYRRRKERGREGEEEGGRGDDPYTPNEVRTKTHLKSVKIGRVSGPGRNPPTGYHLNPDGMGQVKELGSEVKAGNCVRITRGLK